MTPNQARRLLGALDENCSDDQVRDRCRELLRSEELLDAAPDRTISTLVVAAAEALGVDLREGHVDPLDEASDWASLHQEVDRAVHETSRERLRENPISELVDSIEKALNAQSFENLEELHERFPEPVARVVAEYSEKLFGRVGDDVPDLADAFEAAVAKRHLRLLDECDAVRRGLGANATVVAGALGAAAVVGGVLFAAGLSPALAMGIGAVLLAGVGVGRRLTIQPLAEELPKVPRDTDDDTPATANAPVTVERNAIWIGQRAVFFDDLGTLCIPFDGGQHDTVVVPPPPPAGLNDEKPAAPWVKHLAMAVGFVVRERIEAGGIAGHPGERYREAVSRHGGEVYRGAAELAENAAAQFGALTGLASLEPLGGREPNWLQRLDVATATGAVAAVLMVAASAQALLFSSGSSPDPVDVAVATPAAPEATRPPAAVATPTTAEIEPSPTTAEVPPAPPTEPGAAATKRDGRLPTLAPPPTRTPPVQVFATPNPRLERSVAKALEGSGIAELQRIMSAVAGTPVPAPTKASLQNQRVAGSSSRQAAATRVPKRARVVQTEPTEPPVKALNPFQRAALEKCATMSQAYRRVPRVNGQRAYDIAHRTAWQAESGCFSYYNVNGSPCATLRETLRNHAKLFGSGDARIRRSEKHLERLERECFARDLAGPVAR